MLNFFSFEIHFNLSVMGIIIFNHVLLLSHCHPKKLHYPDTITFLVVILQSSIHSHEVLNSTHSTEIITFSDFSVESTHFEIILLFIHLISTYLLSIFYVPDTVLDTRNKPVNRRDRHSCPCVLCISVDEEDT